MCEVWEKGRFFNQIWYIQRPIMQFFAISTHFLGIGNSTSISCLHFLPIILTSFFQSRNLCCVLCLYHTTQKMNFCVFAQLDVVFDRFPEKLDKSQNLYFLWTMGRVVKKGWEREETNKCDDLDWLVSFHTTITNVFGGTELVHQRIDLYWFFHECILFVCMFLKWSCLQLASHYFYEKTKLYTL